MMKAIRTSSRNATVAPLICLVNGHCLRTVSNVVPSAGP
jgi:hypothetical protein